MLVLICFSLARPQERLLWLIDLMEVGTSSESGSSSTAVAIGGELRVRADVRWVGGGGQALPGASTCLGHVSSRLVSPSSTSSPRGSAEPFLSPLP